jgi:hypothetical protein
MFLDPVPPVQTSLLRRHIVVRQRSADKAKFPPDRKISKENKMALAFVLIAFFTGVILSYPVNPVGSM